MIQLPQDRAITRRAISKVNQLLVNRGDYRLVQALLQEGKRARFRLPCVEVQSFDCLFCDTEKVEGCLTLFDCLFHYLDDRIDPRAGDWVLGYRCVPLKAEVEILLEPTAI
jgi:hypothetical protein